MPSLDLPLSELKQYQGTNPRPSDFDSFWRDALAEVMALPLAYELREDAFQVPSARCARLTFTGVGGALVHAKFLTPAERARPGPALLNFHGYGMNCGTWFEKLPFVMAGFTVAAMDCRGQGGLSEDTGGAGGYTLTGHLIRGLWDVPQKMLMRNIFLDAVQMARVVMSMPGVDPSRVGAFGRSQGAGLALACGALCPAVKKTAVRYPFLSDYQRVWELDLGEDAYEEIRAYFRTCDPTHQREAEFFTRLGYIDVQHLAPRVGGEVLMAATLMDRVCPPSAQFAVYNKIRAPKRLVVFPEYGHETLPEFDDQMLAFFLDLL